MKFWSSSALVIREQVTTFPKAKSRLRFFFQENVNSRLPASRSDVSYRISERSREGFRVLVKMQNTATSVRLLPRKRGDQKKQDEEERFLEINVSPQSDVSSHEILGS